MRGLDILALIAIRVNPRFNLCKSALMRDPALGNHAYTTP